MSIKGKYPESTPLYAAFLSIGAVAAIAAFAVVMNIASPDTEDKGNDAPAVSTTTTAATEPEGYIADNSVAEEMKDAAQVLVANNYEILSLYYIHGLNHKDEPYGNAPEDGYYTVDDSEYTSLEQLESLVDSTYLPQQAETVKTNPLSYGPIYMTRNNGDLGIIANFTPMEYDISWENPQFSIDPVSDEDCVINITVHNRTSGEEVALKGEMTKTEDGWRLKTILF